MEIGKFKLAKAYLVRPPKKPTSEFLTREEAEIKSPGLFNAEVNENVVTKNYEAEEYINRVKSYVQSKYIDEDFARRLIEKKLKDLEMTQSDLDTSAINFATGGRVNLSIGTQPNNISNQSEPTQLAKFLVDDLSPGPLKDESTIGPGGYEMTAGLNFPIGLKKAKDLIQTGKATFKDARKIVNYFKDEIQGYQGATKIGESTKKDFTPDVNFLKVFNDFKNRYFQGNVSKASKDLGFHERFPKDVEQRFFQSQTGSRTLPEEGRLLTKDFIIPEPSNGMGFSEMTTLMKRDPEKFTSLKLDKEDPNKFLDTESLGHYLGLKFDRSDRGNLIGSGKDQYDFLALQLKKLDVKKNNLGQYNVNDAITKLVEKNKTKLVKGERKSEMGAGRYDLEKKFDPELFEIRNLAKDRVSKRSKGLDIYLPNAVDNAGHPYSLTKSEEKYKNLFKDSNMNKINTLVYQDPLINKELFKTSGYESKYDKMFNKLSNIQNKKITPEIQKELLKIKDDLNENYNYVKNIIKSPKELSKYLPKNTDSKFINYLSKTQGDRIQKIDINIPVVGETFKSKDVFVDMSSVNPEYILGYVNNINPNAKKFKDLSLAEQKIYADNLLIQNSKIVSRFYKEAGFPKSEMEGLEESITMPFYQNRASGGRVGFNEGKLAKVGKFAGKTFGTIDAPLSQALLAAGYQAGEDPLWYTIPAALTETVNKYLNLYEKSPSKAKNFLKSALRILPIETAQKFYPIFSKIGKVGSTTGYPFLKAASEGLKEIKVRGETERAAADFKMSPQKMKELRSKSILSSLPDIKDDAYVPTEQDYSEANEKIQKARDAFALQAKILGSIVGLTEDPLAEKESIYTRGQQVPMSLERVQEGRRSNFGDGTEVPVVTMDDKFDELISFYQDYLRKGGDKDFRTFAKEYIPENFAIGGRVGFADGPKDPKKGLGSLSKRNFLKTLALIPAGIMAIKGGPNLLKKAKPVVETFKKAPPHFIGLVNKIRALGKIVDPKKLLRSEQDRFSNVYDYGEYRMFERTDGQVEIHKQKLMETDYGDGIVSEEYMSYDPKRPKFNKKGEKIEGEYDEVYEENTTYADQYGEMQDVREGVEPETINDGSFSKEELEQLIIEQIEDSIKKGKK